MIIIFLNINNFFMTALLLELLLLLTLRRMKRVLVDLNTIFLATSVTVNNYSQKKITPGVIIAPGKKHSRSNIFLVKIYSHTEKSNPLRSVLF